MKRPSCKQLWQVAAWSFNLRPHIGSHFQLHDVHNCAVVSFFKRAAVCVFCIFHIFALRHRHPTEHTWGQQLCSFLATEPSLGFNVRRGPRLQKSWCLQWHGIVTSNQTGIFSHWNRNFRAIYYLNIEEMLPRIENGHKSPKTTYQINSRIHNATLKMLNIEWLLPIPKKSSRN